MSEPLDEGWLRDAAKRHREQKRIAEEAESLSLSFGAFVQAAWPQLKKNERYRHNWHLDAINEHLEAISAGEIHRLQVWVPPGTMKSLSVSVFWPAWEWTSRPWLRYWGASYETRLAGRLSAMSYNLMIGDWYQERWGKKVRFIRDAEHYYENDQGGSRMATSPESTGTGEHGHRILIDDPINAKAADATSKATLETVNDIWYDGVLPTRGLDGVENPDDGSLMDHARIIIMQRLHEEDLAAHALELEDWVVLCLPERYEDDHPYAWRGRMGLRSSEDLGSTIGTGDIRDEGELLWPDRRSEKASTAMARALGYRSAGQLQQRPAAREGDILKKYWWRFYDPELFKNLKHKDRRPRFTMVVISVDTPLKDKEVNDLCAIQAWGVKGADRYLLDLRKGHMDKGQCRRAIIEMSRYVREMYPNCRHKILIENAGYGTDLIPELKRQLTGVEKCPTGAEGDKQIRAINASDTLSSGNCFLPGYRMGEDELSMPDDKRLSADILDFITNLSKFPNVKHDDDVDAWSLAMNWLRARVIAPGRTYSRYKRQRRVAA